MSILNTLKAVKEDGFDPRKDSVAVSSRLDTGKYPVRLKSAERAVDSNGYERINVVLEVISGDHKDRLEFVDLNFTETLPEFVLEKNGRTLLKLAEFAKVTFTNADLADEEATAEALQRGIGNQFLMDLRLAPNKKNPDYPYRNYDFADLEAAGDNPFGGDSTEDLDSLPF